MKKIIIGIIIAALVVSAFAVVAVNVKKQNSEATKLANYSEQHLLLNAEKRKLEEQRAEYANLRAAETKAGNYLVLFFDSVDENLIDSVYPILNQYGHTGTIVLCNGLVPGEEGNISREDFDFLLSQGWDTAIGYSTALDLSKDNSVEALRAYLDDYIARLSAAGIEIPYTYCFNKGEYKSKFDKVLKEYGFKAVRHSGEKDDGFGSEYLENELYYIGCGVCAATSTKLQTMVDEAYVQDLAYSMSVRYIGDVSIDTRVDCTTTKYKKMLTYLENYCPSTVVCTMSELYEYKQAQHLSAMGVVGEYNKVIEDIDAKIASINEEMAEILSQLQ